MNNICESCGEPLNAFECQMNLGILLAFMIHNHWDSSFLDEEKILCTECGKNSAGRTTS